jgi:hypothetical protein
LLGWCDGSVRWGVLACALLPAWLVRVWTSGQRW